MSRNTALVFEPHNDDFVIGMGGTGIRLREAGWDVVSVVMTDGRYGGTFDDAEQTVQVRVDEKERETELLNTDWINLNYEDQSLGAATRDASDRESVIDDLSDILHRFEPTVAFVTSPLDGHPDHQATNELVASALRQDECNTSLIEYTVWDIPFYSPVVTETNRVFLVEIDDVFEEKLSAIQVHESQLQEYPYSEMTENFNRYLENIYHLDCDAEYVEILHARECTSVLSDFVDVVEATDVTGTFHSTE